jgi:hypothetical protein
MKTEDIFKKDPSLLRPARKYLYDCKARKIIITDGNEEPVTIGKPGHWKRNGLIRYNKPKYPGYKYQYSTLTIKVGINWLWNNWTDKQRKKYTLLKML